MVLLVTGITGFIGTNFVEYYLNAHEDCKILGLTYSGNLKNFVNMVPWKKSNLEFAKGNITDRKFMDSLFRKNEIDGIVNFAAESHVDRSIKDPLSFIEANVYGAVNLMESARQNLMKQNEWKEGFKFMQISTDEVYGSVENGMGFKETDLLKPNNPYAASKAAAEMFLRSYCVTYGFPGLISRCSNNYGPYQDSEKLIPLIINKAMKHLSIPVYGDGKQTRDWLFVKDHCAAIDLIMEKARFGEVYNIGGNNEHTNIDLVKLILSITQEITGDEGINESLITFVEDRKGHDRKYAINSEKLQLKLGWKPEMKFEDGIRKTIEWYINDFDR